MRKDIKRLAALLPTMAMTAGVCAQQRSMTEILSIAQQYYSNRTLITGTRSAAAIELIPSSHFIPSQNNLESFYLCSTQNEGFVLVSADESMPEILGYSSTAIDQSKGLPPGLLHMMKCYSGMSADAAIWKAPMSAQSQVAPMLKTTWDQGTPYNNMCPRDGSTRAMVGCIATSAAQVMKYYEWPATTPSGIIDYTTATKKIKVSIDLSDYKFAWDLMLDAYQEGSYSNAQASAVAKLMYAVGAVSQMDYASTESGASFVFCAQGMNQYFAYDNDMYLLLGDFILPEQLNSLIVDDLDKSHPVLMSGSSADDQVGHAFVLDGYKTEGGKIYYHINWGWSGLADGFYLLNNLTPSDGGVGMGAGTYNNGQLVVLNCKPDDGVTTPVFGQIGSLELSKTQFNSGERLLFDMTIKQLSCILTKEFSGSGCLEIIDQNDKLIEDFELGEVQIPFGEFMNADVRDFSYPSLSDGIYTVRLSLKNKQGKKIDLLTNAGWPEVQVGKVESGLADLSSAMNKNRIFELSGAEKKNASNRTLPAGFYVINGQKVIVK